MNKATNMTALRHSRPRRTAFSRIYRAMAMVWVKTLDSGGLQIFAFAPGSRTLARSTSTRDNSSGAHISTLSRRDRSIPAAIDVLGTCRRPSSRQIAGSRHPMLIRPRRGSPNRHMSEATSHRIPQNLLSWQGRDGLARLHRAGGADGRVDSGWGTGGVARGARLQCINEVFWPLQRTGGDSSSKRG